jgi:hypothetical protein
MTKTVAGEGPVERGVRRPAQRWEGSTHSASAAIAAAQRVLQTPGIAAYTQAEFLSICSELVFRTTGERIWSAPMPQLRDLRCGILYWRDAEERKPDEGVEVVVLLEDGSAWAASWHLPNEHTREAEGWSCMRNCGSPPGDCSWDAEDEEWPRVTQWAYFPGEDYDASLGA